MDERLDGRRQGTTKMLFAAAAVATSVAVMVLAGGPAYAVLAQVAGTIALRSSTVATGVTRPRLLMVGDHPAGAQLTTGR
jgi:hypothetical protein